MKQSFSDGTLFANKACIDSFDSHGDRRSLIGSCIIEDLVHPDDTDRVLGLWQQFLDNHKTGRKFDLEFRRISQHGNVWNRVIFVPWDVEDGEPKFIGLVIDVTAARMTMEKLEERQRFLDSVLEGIPGIVWEADPLGSINYFNRNFTEYTGLPMEDGMGDKWLQATHPEDVNFVKTEFTKILANGSKGQIEHRILSKEKEYRWYLSRFLPLRDEAGIIVKWLGLCSDVHDHKLDKEEALHAMKMKANFFSNLSHELRTPFGGVLGNLELLADSSLTEEQRDLLEVAQLSTETLLSVINDILSFSKLEEGKVKLECIPIDIEESLDELLELLTPLAVSKGVELYGWSDTSVPKQLMGDPTRIRQVLTNLIGNAIKFTPIGYVRVTCSIEYTNGRTVGLLFRVSDSGIGMDEREMSVLFRPFSQSDSSTTRKFGGTGLGLSISRELARLMSGTITCESIKDKGSCFIFQCEAQLPDESNGDLAPIGPCPDSMSNNGASMDTDGNLRFVISDTPVLIVTESENFCSMMHGILQTHCSLTMCSKSTEALDMIFGEQAQYFHYIIIDCDSHHVPDVEKFCQRLQTADPRSGSVRIVVVADMCNKAFKDSGSKLVSSSGFCAKLVQKFKALNMVTISRPVWRRKILSALLSDQSVRRRKRRGERAEKCIEAPKFLVGKIALIAEGLYYPPTQSQHFF